MTEQIHTDGLESGNGEGQLDRAAAAPDLEWEMPAGDDAASSNMEPAAAHDSPAAVDESHADGGHADDGLSDGGGLTEGGGLLGGLSQGAGLDANGEHNMASIYGTPAARPADPEID